MSFTNSFKGFVRVVLGFVIATLVFAGVTASSQNEQSILEIVESNVDTSTFLTAVRAAELEDVLISEGPNTVFVPTNSAFESLPEGVLEALLMEENKDLLVSVLQYHIVSQDLNSSQVLEGVAFTTANDQEISVSQENDSVFVNGDSKLVTVDFDGNNGYVHLLDKVLVPADVDVTGLIASQTEMTPRTGGFTGFVLPAGILGLVLIGSVAGLSGDRFSQVSFSNFR